MHMLFLVVLEKCLSFSKSPSRKADEISSEFIFQLLLAAATIKNLKLCQLNLGKSV